MKYRDRMGNEFEDTTSQDKLLDTVYSHTATRAAVKLMGAPFVSKIGRKFLDSDVSTVFISGFADKNGIDVFDYEETKYTSFNDFFKRRIKSSRRLINKDEDVLISPSDGKVSAYEITNSSTFVIKNSVYTVSSLLRDQKLSERFQGGNAIVIRLTPDDYHRYVYPCSGVKSHNRKINGVLQTVNPVALHHSPVFKENSREYCMIRSEKFGDVIVMEVGALFVGKITNHNTEGRIYVTKGEEKGYFEFGGSTIVLLTQKGKVRVDDDLLQNTKEGFETKLLQGARIGKAAL
ncbi:archaetidylserine decarboxylase [Ruminococcus sp. NK3A76]|uniref:archaetidylserine decarboxylase n=1 Tax=Ruminococcus sp. NK3A76 TaxID=877411 RepID=UPI00048E3108|nr:archaetidylserine decarboxylase [Ruminococcus sp. NK3A76]